MGPRALAGRVGARCRRWLGERQVSPGGQVCDKSVARGKGLREAERAYECDKSMRQVCDTSVRGH